MSTIEFGHRGSRHQGFIPDILGLTGNRVIRTRDLRTFYSNPANEAGRLAQHGILLKLSNGYYVIVPEERRNGGWRPAIEDVALGIGVADYGAERAPLVGPSAARVLGALPRALSVGVLAAPVHRSPLKTTAGQVVFSFQKIERLDVQRTRTELVTGYASTAEQCVLDLAARPTLGGISPSLAAEARQALLRQCDLHLVASLAQSQHRRAALDLVLAEAAAQV